MAAGGMLAILDQIFKNTPTVVLGFLIITIMVVLLTTVASFALRETKGQPLPETIENMPTVSNGSGPTLSPISIEMENSSRPQTRS